MPTDSPGSMSTLIVLSLSELFRGNPGLLGRGVMFGIPEQTSFMLLLRLAEIVPVRHGMIVHDDETRDIMMDMIGYCEEDHYENIDPHRFVYDEQHYYELGMVEMAYRLRRQLPFQDSDKWEVTLDHVPSEAFFQGTTHIVVKAMRRQ